MANFKCKMCGGELNVKEGQKIVTCEFCGSSQTVPGYDNEKKIAFYNRANTLRLNCYFDKAAGVYETIVMEYPNDSEAYWGLVLCKYGIEYIDDFNTGKKVPTCHRMQYKSIYEDTDYQNAIKFSDVITRELYLKEAQRISELQRNILEISSKEEPFDIFICYKETDANGNRTNDSVIAYNIYNELVKKGYRVFYSKITLEKILGQNYEPYIFSALHSARLMIHVTTSLENSESIWVKNEWSRYIKLIIEGQNKSIITCYKDIMPKELPIELQNIQGQDMAKIGSMEDLVYGINKIFNGRLTLKENLNVNYDSHEKEKDKPTQSEILEYEYNKRVKELQELDDFCLYSSDIQCIIDFFEKAGSYKESPFYLKEAKYQFAKKVNSYLDCLKASNYLDEIIDYKDAKQIKEILLEKAINFKKVELQRKGMLSLDYIPNNSDNLCNMIDSLIRTKGNEEKVTSEVEKKIIIFSHRDTIDNILNYSNKIIDSENNLNNLRSLNESFSKMDESFPNIKEIKDFKESIIKKIKIIEETNKINAEKRRKVKLIKLSIVLIFIVASIIGIVIFSVNKYNGYSADNFKIKVISKVNDEIDNRYGYYYIFKFVVENNSPNDATYIAGRMEINNSSGLRLSSATVTMNGEFKSDDKKNWDIRLNVSNSLNAIEIWETDFDYLEVTFKITEIHFSNGKEKVYKDAEDIIVHECEKQIDQPSFNDSNINQNNDLLSLAKRYVSTDVVIPDNYSSGDYNSGVECFSYADNKYHDSFYIFFIISEEYSSTFFNDFITKLLNSGFTVRRDLYGEWEYIKNNTVIHFGNVCESYIYDVSTGEEKLEYYYFNFYTFSLE